MPTLYIIRGLPGAGKSTFAKNVINKTPQARWKELRFFEADDFFTMADGSYKFDSKLLSQAHNMCFLKTLHALRQGYDVIVANTFTTMSEMRRYIDIKDDFEMDSLNIVIYEIKTSFGSIHNVPVATLDNMAKRWQDIPEQWLIDNNIEHHVIS